MNPFLYPKGKHQRQLEPPFYITYSSFKRFLRLEFSAKCVYCRLPDGPMGSAAFGVDHYRPKSKPEFRHLATQYTNLFYACNACNSRKGSFWPSDNQLRDGKFIPNPCDHIMFEHLRYRSARVESRSAAGKQADDILDFNDEDSVQYREFILDMIKYAETQKREVEQTLKIIDVRMAEAPSPQLALEKLGAESAYARVVTNLRRLGS